MKQRILTLAIAAGLMAGALPCHAEPSLDRPVITLPDFGDPASSAMSNTEETHLGLKLLRELRGSDPIVEDPELSEWLQALGKRLAAHAPGGKNYYFLIAKNPDINAYAMPGGVVVIHSGLIINTTSESELAAVIAHEIAHVSQRHIARMMADEKGSPWLMGLGVLAGAAAATKNPDAGEAIMTGTIAAQAHQQLAFSRDAEFEADRIGLQILAGSSFDPGAMPSFLEKLDRRAGNQLYGDINKYLQTHPLSIERVSDARSRANKLGSGRAQEDVDYLYAREKLRVLTAPNSSAQTDGNSAVAQYAQAIRLLRSGNGAAALQKLNAGSGQLPILLASAEAMNSTRRYDDAEKLLMPLARSHPGHEGILSALADALLANGKAAQAWQLLSQQRLDEQSSLEFLETRQRVAEQAGQAAEAYTAAAERSLRMGEYKYARASLDQATRLPGTSAYTMARLQAMSQDIRRMESTAKKLDKF
jgi:predicted Zn-dependent protease